MISFLKKQWRAFHVSKDYIRINKSLRFHKKTLRIIDVSKRIPNLIILGSQKCGTTSLYFYLNTHPEIALSSPEKEPGYFIFDEWAKIYWKRQNRNVNSKEDLLMNYMVDSLTEQKYFCDASTYYTQDNNELKYDIPELISKTSKETKFIYIIRDPFGRLTSLYYHFKRNGIPAESIDGMLNDWIINTTLYYDRISPYIKKFGIENIHIIQLSDLIENPQKTLNNIFEFLNLETVLISDFKTHNKTTKTSSEKFTHESFIKLKPQFERQKMLLEANLGLQLSWNLDYHAWVESK